MQTLHLALSTASAGWPCPTQHPAPLAAPALRTLGMPGQLACGSKHRPPRPASLAHLRCDQLTQTPAMTLAAPLDAADPAAATTARLPAARPSLRSQPSRRGTERAALTSGRPLGCQEAASSCAARRFAGLAWPRGARRARPPTLAGQGGCPRRGSRLLRPRARVDEQGGWRRARGRLAGGRREGGAGRRLPPRRDSEAPAGALARTRTTLGDNGVSPPCADGLHVCTATVPSE